MPETLTLAQFAARHGLTTTADVQSHIHAGLRMAPTSKTYRRSYDATLRRLQDERDETTRLFLAAIDRGEIREPDRLERLTAAANGHEDNRATLAARRVLERRKQRQKEAAR